MTDKIEKIIGNCEKIVQLNQDIRKIAKLNNRVLITGETGTGKTIVAKHIHELSGKTGKFITIASINNAFLEDELFGHMKGAYTGAGSNRTGAILTADGGTIFLDEIGEISCPVQVKLLRLLETGEFSPLGSDEIKKANVRMIFATNRNLYEKMIEGEFREDLFHRINGINIKIPSLLERKDDLYLWIDYFFDKISISHPEENTKKLKAEFIEIFSHYHWPGNLRELKNYVENTFALGRIPDLPNNFCSMVASSTGQNNHKNNILTKEEELFIFQSKIYNRLKTLFAKKIFEKINPGEFNTEKAELLFMCPFIQSAIFANCENKGAPLGISHVNFVTWYHKLRNLGYLDDNGFETNKGNSLPIGINLTYILRNLFIPQFYFLTVEAIKKRGVRAFFANEFAEAAAVLDIKKKDLQGTIRQHNQNQKRLTDLNIW